MDDTCDLNPEFAVICSFIAQFGDNIDLELNIEQLKSSIEEQSHNDETLIDLHVKLLKKVRRYFVRDQWEKALIGFTSEYSYEDACEIEQLGYQKTRPSIKLRLLRRLLEAQFECDQKFKAAVNLCEPQELRILPAGRDIKGNTYWHRSDTEGNFRIFQEEPLDYQSWKTVCSKPEDLANLIDELDKIKDDKVKGEPILEPYHPLPQIFPEFFTKKEEEQEKPNEVNGGSENRPTRKAGRGKKGRGRGKGSKKSTSLLAALKEEHEEEEVAAAEKSNNVLNTHDTENFRLKQENEPTNPNLPRPSMNSNDFSEHISIESHVKWTLENLLTKVVSSFEYLIRPLSRNSSHEEATTPITATSETKKPARKKAAKREKCQEEILPRRSSSRIQQLQLKKIAEQEVQIKEMIESNSNKKSCSITPSLDEDSRSRTSFKNHKRRSESPEDGLKNGRKRRKEGQSWRRGKKKKKLSWDKDDSDLSDTSSLTESNDDEFEEADEEFKFGSNNEDDEFACEDEETNIEPVIIKRARTARQCNVPDEQGNLNTSSVLEEDKPCGRCDKSNDPEWILLCDMCDDGYHISCCLPPLMMVPDGDWYCASCEHKMLLIKLRSIQVSIKELLEAKELERKKKQRLRQNNVKKETVKPQPQEQPLTEKRQRFVLEELSDPLALQALDEELEEQSSGEEYSGSSYRERAKNRTKKTTKPKKAKRRPSYEDEDDDYDEIAFNVERKRPHKTYSRKSFVNDSEEEEEESYNETEEDELSGSSEEPKPKTRRARASVSYRFQEYDELIKSAIRDSYDEDESEQERDSTPEGCNYGRGKDMATIEALAYQQENGLDGQSSAPVPNELTKPKPRKKARRLNDLDAASETEDADSDESFQASTATEAEEDEDLTEADDYESDTSIDELVRSSNLARSSKKKKAKKRASYESDDSDYQPSRSRRAAAMRVSYKESTDDDEDGAPKAATPKKTKRNILSSDEESQASWKSSAHSIAEENSSIGSCEAESPLILPEGSPGSPPLPPPADIANQYKPEPTTNLIGPMVMPTEKVRDPIQELIQYCNDSANSSPMFDPFNETSSTVATTTNNNPVTVPVHPPFYQDGSPRP